MQHSFISHYSDNVVIEFLGFALEKAISGDYDDAEYLEKRISQLSTEMRNRKLQYCRLVINNDKSPEVKKKKSDS